ncbi:MAG: hypothetical protein H7326_03680 [Bdellovibrionaceae bacterium]|nr:hypothetical protein [Pseudobdellovibrionaceae bacterium]
MSLNRPFTILSLAQIVCTFALAVSFGVSERAFADDCDSEMKTYIKDNCEKKEAEKVGGDLYNNCRSYKKICATVAPREREESSSCRSKDRYDLAQKELAKSCGKAGYGSNCQSAIDACEDLAESDEFDGGKSNAFLEAIGTSIGATNFNSTGNKCPTLAGKDYFRDKKDIEKDIKDNSKDLADLKKETAELEDSYNKDIQEVQTGITEAQEKLKSDKLDMSKEQRQRTTESAKTTTEVAAQIRAKQTQNLSIRNQMAEVYRSKNSNLLQMSETASKLACMKKVRELRKAYDTDYAGASNKGGLGFIKQASAKKQELNDTFLDCMSQFDVQRNALIAQTEEKIQVFQDMINSNISDIDNATQQLASMQIQEHQAKADDTTKMNDAAQSVIDKIAKAQARLTSLATTQTKKAKAITDKQAEMEADSRKKSNELAALGTVPKSKTSTMSLQEVEGDYSTVKSARDDFEEASKIDGPCKGLYRSADSPKTTPSSRSSTTRTKR